MAALSYPLGHKVNEAPALVLQKALALDVVLSVVGEKLHAAGDRASVAELAPLLRQHRADLVHLLTSAANDPAPGTRVASTPAPDRHGANTVPAPARPEPPTPAPKPPGWLHMDQPWRAADAAYLAHWGLCPTCKATATGHSERCAAGQYLHDAYDKAVTTAMKGINT